MMSSKPIFLDVDSSIVERNLKITNDEEEEQFNKLLGETNYPFKVVKPSPGMCVKTKEVGTDTKVFINICQTDAIPPPKDITPSELLRIIGSDEPSDYKVPMSINVIRPEKDKKDQEVKACDIAIHPSFFRKVEGIPEFRNFFMGIVFQALEDKYGLFCQDDKIILRNRKAYGTLQPHRIQQREIEQKMREASGGAKSLLEEVGVERTMDKGKVAIETLDSRDKVMREPEYRLYRKKDSRNCLYGEFKLPDVISINDITLNVGEDRIVLESKTRGYFLDIFIPYIVKQKNCKAHFHKQTKILTLAAPLVGG